MEKKESASFLLKSLDDAPSLRIKVEMFPEKMKAFEEGCNITVVTFSPEIDSYKRKNKTALKVFGKKLFHTTNLSEDTADELNDLFFKARKLVGSIKPERFLALLYSVYLLGLYLQDSENNIFKKVDKKNCRKFKFEKRDLYLETNEVSITDIVKRFGSLKEILHKNLDVKVVKQEFPPRLKSRTKYDSAWLSKLSGLFKPVSPILLLPAPKTKVQDLSVQREKGLCYLKVEETIHKVPPKVFKFAQYLATQGVDNEAKADKQDWLLQKAGLRGGSISELWKEKRAPKNQPLPVPLLKVLFLSIRGKYYLNPKVMVLPII